MQYVALLRGINVGGNTLIKMSDLKKLFEKAGCTHVTTLLASGNVVFESAQKDAHAIAKRLETALEIKYGRRIATIVRPMHDIAMLAKKDPFKGIPVTKDTRLYVTFLHKSVSKHLTSDNKFFRIVKTCPFAVCSVLILTPDRATLDLMSALQRHYGADITTRNWNTVQKVLLGRAGKAAS